MTRPADFLCQKNLVDDYLPDSYDDIVGSESNNDFILNQVLIWAIVHFVVFQQFSRDEVHTIFYENVAGDANGEIGKLSRLPGHDEQGGSIPRELIDRPSRVSDRDASAVPGGFRGSWSSGLSTQQIDQGLRILERFGLSGIYARDGMPHEDALKRFRIGSPTG